MNPKKAALQVDETEGRHANTCMVTPPSTCPLCHSTTADPKTQLSTVLVALEGEYVAKRNALAWTDETDYVRRINQIRGGLGLDEPSNLYPEIGQR